MVKIGDLIKHIKFVDVACLVKGIHGDWLYVQWVNLGYVDSWILPTEFIGIRPNSKNWLVCKPDKDYQCYRNAPWVLMEKI